MRGIFRDTMDETQESGHSFDQRLARTFVGLADTLVDEFDLLDFLRSLVEQSVYLLDVTAAGVVLADPKEGLRVAAASSEQVKLLEVLAVQAADGPCVECLGNGQAVGSTDLAADLVRWPKFAPAAHEAGFQAVRALPMRLRRQVIGVLTLLNDRTGEIDEQSRHVGQAMADIATIGILQQRAIDRSETVVEQLQTALTTRVVIEQAKGVLSAHSGHSDMEHVFTALRAYARSHNVRLTDLSRKVVDGTVDVDAILARRTRSS